MRQQTVCVNATPGDARRAAEEIAANLRTAGNTVTIGEEYTLTQTHKAGLLAVDITIEEPLMGMQLPDIPQTLDEVVTHGIHPHDADGNCVLTVMGTPDAPEPPLGAEDFPAVTDEPAEAVEIIPFDEELEFVAEPEKPAKNKGGRPKGSKTNRAARQIGDPNPV